MIYQFIKVYDGELKKYVGVKLITKEANGNIDTYSITFNKDNELVLVNTEIGCMKKLACEIKINDISFAHINGNPMVVLMDTNSQQHYCNMTNCQEAIEILKKFEKYKYFDEPMDFNTIRF